MDKRTKRILLVDDDQAICSMLCAALDADDREVVEAHNGVEAQKLLAESTFDLVITDIIMPDCDGIELIMAMRKKRTEIPVIMISGGGRMQAHHYLNLAKKLGADSIFEKPFSTKKLSNKVAELLGESDTTQTTN